MTLELLRSLARAHAMLAWLSAAALVTAAWAHLRRRLPAWAGGLAAALAVAAGATGLMMEAGYRARIRQKLFLRAPSIGWLFERKEHLAVGAVLLAVAAAAALAASRRARSEEAARDLRRAATVAWVAAAALSVAATAAGTIVARTMGF